MNLFTTHILKRGWIAIILGLLAMGASVARAGDFKFEAQLVWATNDEKSPDDKHKPVEESVKKILEDLPLKWKSFFEVNRDTFTVPKAESKKVTLSEKCTIEVKIVDGKKIEVTFYNKKGEVCHRQTQPLEKGKSLVLGGNAPNKTAWLVVIKRIE